MYISSLNVIVCTTEHVSVILKSQQSVHSAEQVAIHMCEAHAHQRILSS